MSRRLLTRVTPRTRGNYELRRIERYTYSLDTSTGRYWFSRLADARKERRAQERKGRTITGRTRWKWYSEYGDESCGEWK